MNRPQILFAAFILCISLASALEIPPLALSELNAEKFAVRETAQANVLKWAREQDEDSVRSELFRQSQEAEDPEVRARCLAVLKELVSDDYLKEGEGYIGIRMQDEFANFPDDPKPRGVIRVIQVVPDSAAAKAGLLLNDLIGELDGNIWREQPVSIPFGERIRQHKPGEKVRLKVLREGKVVEVVVSLGRRPLIADAFFFSDDDIDVEAMEKKAKDAFFRRWMENKKAEN